MPLVSMLDSSFHRCRNWFFILVLSPHTFWLLYKYLFPVVCPLYVYILIHLILFPSLYKVTIVSGTYFYPAPTLASFPLSDLEKFLSTAALYSPPNTDQIVFVLTPISFFSNFVHLWFCAFWISQNCPHTNPVKCLLTVNSNI